MCCKSTENIRIKVDCAQRTLGYVSCGRAHVHETDMPTVELEIFAFLLCVHHALPRCLLRPELLFRLCEALLLEEM